MLLKKFSESERQKRCLAWAGLGVTLFVTSFVWSPSRDGLDVIFYLFFFIPLLLVLPWQKPSMKDYGGWFSVSALAYAAVAVVACFWGELKDLPFFLWHWIVLAFWLCGVSWIFREKSPDMQRIYVILIVVGLLVAATAFINFYSQNPLSERMIGWSVARYPIVVAQTFGAVALIAYILSLQANCLKKSFLYFCASFLLLVPLVFSQSRGPALAFIIMAVVALLLIRPSFKVICLHMIVAIGGIIAALLFTDIAQILADRGISLSLRDVIWREVWVLSLENPWVGSGSVKMDHMQLPSGYFHHPHNAWLDIFYRTGLIGLILSVAHLLILVRSFSRDKELLPLYLWLGFGCLCVFTDSRVLFWELNAKWFMYWIPAGLIGALVMARRAKEKDIQTI